MEPLLTPPSSTVPEVENETIERLGKIVNGPWFAVSISGTRVPTPGPGRPTVPSAQVSA